MFSHHRLKRGSYFLLTLTLTVLLSFAEKKEIHAQEKPARQTNYSLPRGGNSNENQENERIRSVRRKTGGSRGGRCNSLPSEVVTAIAPEDHIGTTVSARPTVLWFSKQNISQPMRITFYSPGEHPILVENFSGLSQGFGAFTIPEDNPGLEIGKLYKWTVTVVCNEKRPSKNLYAQGLIERIPESVNQNLENSSCNVDFATLGIWYDAIACSYSQLNVPKDYPAFYEEDFNYLLEQVNLSELKINGSGFQNVGQNPE